MSAEKIDPDERAEILERLSFRLGIQEGWAIKARLEMPECGPFASYSRQEQQVILAYFWPIEEAMTGYIQGRFLTSFARAILSANKDDFDLLMPAAFRVIRRYNLQPESESEC